MWHWITQLWWPESGMGYALGSSWAGDTGMFAIVGLWYTLWKRHNCHEHWCPRVARHTIDTDGHHTMYCSKHVGKHK